jgi:hypothetical protein
MATRKYKRKSRIQKHSLKKRKGGDDGAFSIVAKKVAKTGVKTGTYLTQQAADFGAKTVLKKSGLDADKQKQFLKGFKVVSENTRKGINSAADFVTDNKNIDTGKKYVKDPKALWADIYSTIKNPEYQEKATNMAKTSLTSAKNFITDKNNQEKAKNMTKNLFSYGKTLLKSTAATPSNTAAVPSKGGRKTNKRRTNKRRK